MGEYDVSQTSDAAELRRFTQHLLADLRAFQQMLDDDMFESGVSRIGAEQELFLVDRYWRPASNSLEVLELIDDPRCTTELGRFNIEFNLDPLDFSSDCLRRLETELESLLAVVREAAARLDTQAVQIGILPTLEKRDLTLDNMTPMERYYGLNEAMNRLRGANYELRIKGRDELMITHDNVMLEACNTSFQVHFQVSPADFAHRYNIAQAVAAPILAAATNSPLLFGRQLWRETRIALFQQSIDTRPATPYLTEQQPRVSFGRDWVKTSPVEIFREDITRFRVLMSREIDEDPFALLAAGKAPRLRALTLHNGTVYRWNRPCYGVTDGKPHLRIENRVLPSGPTVLDEVANAAFWFGMMTGMDKEYPDITEVMDFEDARENLVAAARRGLGSHLAWPERGHVAAHKLILEELLPLARRGLAAVGIDEADNARYLDTIEARVESQFTGSQWQVDSMAAMKSRTTESERLAAVVAGALSRQTRGQPGAHLEAGLGRGSGRPADPVPARRPADDHRSVHRQSGRGGGHGGLRHELEAHPPRAGRRRRSASGGSGDPPGPAAAVDRQPRQRSAPGGREQHHDPRADHRSPRHPHRRGPADDARAPHQRDAGGRPRRPSRGHRHRARLHAHRHPAAGELSQGCLE